MLYFKRLEESNNNKIYNIWRNVIICFWFYHVILLNNL